MGQDSFRLIMVFYFQGGQGEIGASIDELLKFSMFGPGLVPLEFEMLREANLIM
jgi:hypothetical protein